MAVTVIYVNSIGTVSTKPTVLRHVQVRMVQVDPGIDDRYNCATIVGLSFTPSASIRIIPVGMISTDPPPPPVPGFAAVVTLRSGITLLTRGSLRSELAWASRAERQSPGGRLGIDGTVRQRDRRLLEPDQNFCLRQQ